MMILHKFYFNKIFNFLEGFRTLLSDPFKPERIVRKVHLANLPSEASIGLRLLQRKNFIMKHDDSPQVLFQ